MNPDLVRWMLLMGQMDQPTTEEQELVYGLYYKFFSMAMPKAKFLLPLDAASGFPEDNSEGDSFVWKKTLTLIFPLEKEKMDEIPSQSLPIGNV